MSTDGLRAVEELAVSRPHLDVDGVAGRTAVLAAMNNQQSERQRPSTQEELLLAERHPDPYDERFYDVESDMF